MKKMREAESEKGRGRNPGQRAEGKEKRKGGQQRTREEEWGKRERAGESKDGRKAGERQAREEQQAQTAAAIPSAALAPTCCPTLPRPSRHHRRTPLCLCILLRALWGCQGLQAWRALWERVPQLLGGIHTCR